MLTYKLTTTLVALYMATLALAMGVGASPSRIEHSVSTGSQTSISGKLSIIAQGEIKVSISDWIENINGNPVLLPPGSLEQSLAPWIKIDKTQVSVQNGTDFINYRIEVPPNAEGTYYAAILLEPATHPRTQVAKGLWLKHRLVLLVPVYLHIEGTEVPQIKLLDVVKTGDELTFYVANVGNAAVKTQGVLQGIDAMGNVVEETLLFDEEFLPGEKRRFQANRPNGVITRFIITAPGVSPIIWEESYE